MSPSSVPDVSSVPQPSLAGADHGPPGTEPSLPRQLALHNCSHAGETGCVTKAGSGDSANSGPAGSPAAVGPGGSAGSVSGGLLSQLESADLARYRQLQEVIAELQGLQIEAQVVQARRGAAALQVAVEAVQDLVEASRQELEQAQVALIKYASNAWYPLRYLCFWTQQGRLDASREDFKEATSLLQQRKQALWELELWLQKATTRLEAWQEKAAQLAAALREAEEMEQRLFAQPVLVRQGDIGLVDALCAAGGEVEEGSEGSESESGASQASGSNQAPRPGRQYFRGRLIHAAARRLNQVLSPKGARKAQGQRPQRAPTASGAGARPLLKPNQYAEHFPDAANKFNPLLHCPPSTFLFPFSHKFMGKLQRLQTGTVLQAFYRFGPCTIDPRLPQAEEPGGGSCLPPLILLAGLGATMIAWGVPLLRALACTHDVIVMEYRGAGLSVDSSGQPWSYSGQAEAVLLLAEALGIHRPNILGWSSGGNVGLMLAAFHGDRVGKVASLAGMAGGKNTIVPPMYEMLNPDRTLTLGQTMALLFPPEDPDFRSVVGAYLRGVVSMPGAITNSTVGAKSLQEQWEADKEFIHHDERVWAALPSVSTPVLLMNGEQDVLVPPKNAERLARRIPGARLHRFPSWGHAYKSPVELAEVVNDFLLS